MRHHTMDRIMGLAVGVLALVREVANFLSRPPLEPAQAAEVSALIEDAKKQISQAGGQTGWERGQGVGQGWGRPAR